MRQNKDKINEVRTYMSSYVNTYPQAIVSSSSKSVKEMFKAMPYGMGTE